MFQLSFDSFAQIKCQMDFSLYPFDTQKCPFAITLDRNLTYQVKKSSFECMEKLNLRHILQEFNTTIRLGANATHEKFDLSLEMSKSITLIDEDTNETFSKSGFTVILERSPTRFYINIYLPTFLLTIASFIGFLIPVDMVPGRMALLVTIFLMLVNISNTEQNRGPIVSPHTNF